MAKLTIIVPAYNAANTLEECVKSVLAQTLRDIEVMLVDDGSTDETPRICDALEQLDSRVSVVHQQNLGCYQARLNALKRVSSLYFGFVDADDTIEPMMYADMVRYAEENALDVVQCGICGCVQKGNRRAIFDTRESVMDHYIIPTLVKGNSAALVWDKIYRNQYDFSDFDETDHVTMGEDMIFNLQFFLKVKRMGVLSCPYYHYNVNAGSSVRNFRIRNLRDFAETIRIRDEMLPYYGYSAKSKENRRWIAKNMRNQLISAAVAPSERWRERVRRVRAVMNFSHSPSWMKWFPAVVVTSVIYVLKKIH